MIPGSREKRGVGASIRAGQPAAGVTLVAAPRRREARTGGHLYLERASLIEMTERPLLVVSRPPSGEQTQIVRRPVRKADGRRWIFIFGGAATATLLTAWLGFAHDARTAQPALAAKAPAAPTPPARQDSAAARPIVAPMAAQPVVFASTTPSVALPVAPARHAARPVPASVASGRHTKAAPARLASSSRLAARRAPAHTARPAATVAWVDPFIDR